MLTFGLLRHRVYRMALSQIRECLMEPELRSEFIKGLKASETEKTVKVKELRPEIFRVIICTP
jgi:hypothetical protein